MKKLLIICTIFTCFNFYGQLICEDVSTCLTDKNLPSIVGTSAPSGLNYGCLGATPPNPEWLFVTIEDSGPIEFTISQTNIAGTPTDVDFAMWGPFTDIPDGCTQINANLSPLQCSYSPSPTETIGIGLNGGSGSGQSTPPDAIAGQIYAILVTNFNGSPGAINITNTGGSGTTVCCEITDLEVNVTSCIGPGLNEYQINGQLEFNNSPSDGELNLIFETPISISGNDYNTGVTQPNGSTVYHEIQLGFAPFSSPFPYTINGLTADGSLENIKFEFSRDDGCIETDNFTLAPPEAGPDEEFCFGEPITLLTGFSPPGGTWSGTGVDATTGEFNPSVGVDSYTLTYELNGCEDSKIVTVKQQPVINPITDQTVCETFTFPAIIGAYVTASAAYYTGTGTTGTQFNIGEVYSILGTISLYAYDVNTGCESEEQFSLNIVSTDFTSSNSPTICGNNDGSINVIPSSGSASLNITIDNGVDPPETNSTGIFNGLSSGTYNITVNDPINDITNTCLTTGQEIVDASIALTFDDSQPSTTTPTSCNPEGSLTASDPLLSSGTAPLNYTIVNVLDLSTTINDDPANPGYFPSLNAGTYDLTVTDDAGCSDTQLGIVVDALNPISLSLVSFTDDHCGDGTRGEIEVQASGGLLPYSFSLDDGINVTAVPPSNSLTYLFDNLEEGSYTVTVTDDDNCEAQIIQDLDESPIEISDVQIITNTTCGEDNGAIGVTLDGGQFPFDITIYNGTFPPQTQLSDLPPGTYDVRVVDNNSCEFVYGNVLIESSYSPIISSVDSTNTTCNNSNGVLQVNVISGQFEGQNQDYTVTIDNGVDPAQSNNTGLFTDLNPATYIVTVEDNKLCNDNSNITDVIIGPSFALTVDVDTLDATCGDANGQIAISVLTGGNIPINYTIDNGTISKSNTIGNFDLLNAGDYTVTVVDVDGCSDVATTTLLDNIVLIDNNTAFNTTCDSTNGKILFSGIGGTTPYSYSVDNGVNTPPVSNSTGIFEDLPHGDYTLTVTDGIGCEDKLFNIEILPSTLPNFVNILPEATTCGEDNGELILTATFGTPGYKFYIDNLVNTPPDTNFTGIYDSLPSGTYTLIVQDAEGCVKEGSTTILSSDELTIGAEDDTTTCGVSNGELEINILTGGTEPIQYTIDNGNSQSNFTGTFILLPSAEYTISVEDNKGCIDSVIATVHDTTLYWESVVIQDITCFGDGDGQIEINLPANSGEAFYSIDNGVTSQATGQFSGLQPATYTIKIEDNYGCTVDSTVEVNTPDELVSISLPDTTVCIGGTVTSLMEITGGTGVITYNWTQGVSVGNPSNYSPTANGVISVHGVDENGCRSEDTEHNISLYPPLTVTASSVDEKICEGDSTIISAVASGGIGGPYSYNWNNGVPDTSSYQVKPTDTTEYIITLTDGCETPAARDTVIVNVNTLQNVDFISSEREGCIPFTIDFEELLDAYNGSCTWDFGDFSSSTDCQDVSHLYNTVGCFDVSLTLIDSNNCKKVVEKIEEICAYQTPVADFINDRSVLSLLEPEVSFTNESIDADQYIWKIGDATSTVTYNSEDLDFTFKNYEPGEYTVCLEALTNPGCTDTLCTTIKLNDNYLFYMPSSFSPNQDGINDEFGPVMNGVADNYVFNVYNRWGEVIFTSTEDFPTWNGDYNNNGVLCPLGVYVWKIELLDQVNDVYKEYIGNVTIVR